jgi:hypothetical protein
MTDSPLETQHDKFFVQKVWVGDELVGKTRFEVFRQICTGRRVLHVGCVDWPITDPANSLHVFLDGCCAQLDGFDIHDEAFPALRHLVRGRLCSDWADIVDEYDIVLVPEVMEHVPNVAEFLRRVDSIRASHVVLTVPDAYQCARGHFDYNAASKTFVEVVHPDHNCWYTPFTLQRTISKFTDWAIQGIWFFNRISLLTIASKPLRGATTVTPPACSPQPCGSPRRSC